LSETEEIFGRKKTGFVLVLHGRHTLGD